MSEANDIVQLAAPYISYVLPALIIFSTISVSDYIIDFVFFIIRKANKRVTIR